MSYVSRHKGWMIVGILSAIAAAVIEIWTGRLVEQLTTQAENGAGPIVLQIVYTVFVVILIGVPAKFFMSFGVERSSASAVQDIRNHVMRHIGKLPVPYLVKQHSGDVLSRINNDLQAHPAIYDSGPRPVVLSSAIIYRLFLLFDVSPMGADAVQPVVISRSTAGFPMDRQAVGTVDGGSPGKHGPNEHQPPGYAWGMPIVKSYLLSGMLSRSYQVLLQLTAQKSWP